MISYTAREHGRRGGELCRVIYTVNTRPLFSPNNHPLTETRFMRSFITARILRVSPRASDSLKRINPLFIEGITPRAHLPLARKFNSAAFLRDCQRSATRTDSFSRTFLRAEKNPRECEKKVNESEKRRDVSSSNDINLKFVKSDFCICSFGN